MHACLHPLLCAAAMDALSSSLLFCATLSILSPVLRTLTKSYADDTISALASFLAFLHIVSHDYNYVNSGIGRYVFVVFVFAAVTVHTHRTSS